jgi:hypothetical protein
VVPTTFQLRSALLKTTLRTVCGLLSNNVQTSNGSSKISLGSLVLVSWF